MSNKKDASVTDNEATEAKDIATVENKAIADTSWEDAIKAKQAQQAAQRAALSTGPKFISFKGGHINVDKVVIPGDRLDVIVLTYLGENSFYKGKYDPTITQQPICWSAYATTDDMWPGESVKEQQADSCAECPKFAWGSDPLGGRGKACKTRYRVAVIPAPKEGATEMDILGAELRIATIPVTSVRNFDSFMSKAEMLFNRPMFGVIASLTIVPDAKSQYIVDFTPIEAVHGPLLIPILKRIEEAEKVISYDLDFDDDDAAPAAPTKPLK
jgi:hypothetical protein